MKKILLLLPVTLMFVSNAIAQNSKPFALIELYTSQGCSSCPKADQYLAEMIRNAAIDNSNIMALSFHVDYWNRLGWKDPYSSTANTKRQYAYAKALKIGNVYTPQMVINGSTEFVGSNRKAGDKAINDALSQPVDHALILGQPVLNNNRMTIAYEVAGNTEGQNLNIAIAEKGISTRVGRGENGGRTLKHENVVRAFETYPLSSQKGAVQIIIPDDMIEKNAFIVGFIQKGDFSPIQAATTIPLR